VVGVVQAAGLLVGVLALVLEVTDPPPRIAPRRYIGCLSRTPV